MEIATERARGAVIDEYEETPERESVSDRFDGLISTRPRTRVREKYLPGLLGGSDAEYWSLYRFSVTSFS